MPVLRQRWYELTALAGFHYETSAYGGLKILQQYARVPRWVGLRGVLQHGYLWGSDAPIPYTSFAWPFHQYVWTRKGERWAADNGIRRVRAIGSPWCYMKELSGDGISQDITSLGSILVPQHSTPWHAVSWDHNSISELLRRTMQVAPDTDRVLLGAYDFHHSDWREQASSYGLTCLTAGSGLERHERDGFLWRLMRILSSAKTVVLNDVTTAAIYAIDLGVEVAVVDYLLDYKSAYRKAGQVAEHLQTLSEVSRTNGLHRTAFVDQELGRDVMLSRSDLRNLFLSTQMPFPWRGAA